jgi:hypothetical protein
MRLHAVEITNIQTVAPPPRGRHPFEPGPLSGPARASRHATCLDPRTEGAGNHDWSANSFADSSIPCNSHCSTGIRLPRNGG